MQDLTHARDAPTHKAMSIAPATEAEPLAMLPDELGDILDRLGWSGRMLAGTWNVDERRMRRMQQGRVPVPGPLAEWLRALDRFVEANPIPQPPRREEEEPEVEEVGGYDPFALDTTPT